MRKLTHSKKSWLALAAALAAMLAAAFGAFGYFSSTGSGTGFTTTGTLGAPSITSGTPGGGTVALTWSAVSAPAGGSVAYYVQRDGAAPGGSCATAASPTGATSCTDSGVAIGSHDYTVTAVWRTWTATSGTRTVTVTTGPLNHFLVTPTAVHETAGSPFGVTVTAKDSLGNTITSYAGTIHFASNDGQAVLPGDYAFTTGAGNDNGVHTFSGVTLKTAGTGKTIVVGDGGSSGTATYTVDPGAATQISLAGSIADLTSGPSRAFTATLADAYGNTATSGVDSTASVTFTQVSGLGSVTSTGASAAVSGVATKNLTGALAGPVTIQATANLSGSGSTTSNTLAFNVVHGSASQIALGATAGDLASGTARTFTATVEDAAGNTVTDGVDSTVSVSFAQTAGAGSLSGTGSAPATAGVATKSLTGVLAGSVTVRASATLSVPGATSSNALTFNVVAGPVSQLVVTPQPSGASGGSAFTTQPAITAQDVAGNTVTGYGGSVTLSIKSGTGTAGAALSGCTPSLSSGVTSFSGCKIDKAGSGYQLTATDGTRSVDSNAFIVGVGTAAKLAFTTSPSTSNAGTVFGTQPVVTVQDAGGNTVATDTSNVTLAITSGTGASGAALTCTANPKAAVAGIATFAGCKIDKAGTGYTLTATDGSLSSAVSGTFNISAGPVTQFAVGVPVSVTAGSAFTVTLTAEDAGGNAVTGYIGAHTIIWSGGSTSPSGTAPNYPTSSISFTSGVSTTTLTATFSGAGANGLTATESSVTGTGSLTVNAATATKLAWTHITSTSTTAIPSPCLFACTYGSFGSGKTFTANVSVTDNFGNTVSNLGSGHTVSVTGSGLNGTLTGGSGLTISTTGPADSTTQFTYSSKSSGNYTDSITAQTTSGTTYASATATFSR
jgi:hypothetical protein